MRQTAKFLSVLLIGSLAFIPFGEAQNRDNGHQNPDKKEQAKSAPQQDRRSVMGNQRNQGNQPRGRQGNVAPQQDRRSVMGNQRNQGNQPRGRQGNVAPQQDRRSVMGNPRNQGNQPRGRQGRVAPQQDRRSVMGNPRNQSRARQNGSIMPGNRGNFHRNVGRRAQSRYGSLPRWGSSMRERPSASMRVRFGNASFYYHSGIFYSPYNNGYRVARPPFGIRVSILPFGFRHIMLGRRHYYYYYGTFYDRPYGYNGYEVVRPPLGAIVDALPDGYEIRNINGYEYYYFEGTYYAEVDDSNYPGGIGYQVVQP